MSTADTTSRNERSVCILHLVITISTYASFERDKGMCKQTRELEIVRQNRFFFSYTRLHCISLIVLGSGLGFYFLSESHAFIALQK